MNQFLVDRILGRPAPSARGVVTGPGVSQRGDQGEKIEYSARNADRNQIKTGVGVRRRTTSHGTTLSMLGRTFGWDNAFAVHYYGSKSQINPGMINGQYPKIKGVSIQPDKNGVFPLLDMQDFKNAASWVVVEITRSQIATGVSQIGANTPLIASMEVRHVQNMNDLDISAFFGGALGFPELPGNKTRLPLARIETQQFGNACFQIALFNYNYTIKLVNGKARNYFYPA